MGSAIGLRNDFNGPALRRLAQGSKSANQARRLIALAEVCDSGSRTAAARIGGMGLQIIRDWVVRFNARCSAAIKVRHSVSQDETGQQRRNSGRP